jgi:hypothetical protein
VLRAQYRRRLSRAKEALAPPLRAGRVPDFELDRRVVQGHRLRQKRRPNRGLLKQQMARAMFFNGEEKNAATADQPLKKT